MKKKFLVYIACLFFVIPIFIGMYEEFTSHNVSNIEEIPDSILVICKLDTASMEDYEKQALDMTKPMVVRLIGFKYGIRLETPFQLGAQHLYIKYDKIMDDGRMPWNQDERIYGVQGVRDGHSEFDNTDMPYKQDVNILNICLRYGISHKRIPKTCKYNDVYYEKSYARENNLKEIKFIENWLLR